MTIEIYPIDHPVSSDRTTLYLTSYSRTSQQKRNYKPNMSLRGKRFVMRPTKSIFCKLRPIAFIDFHQDKPVSVRYSHIPCNSWTCELCAPKKALYVMNLLRQVIVMNNLKYFLSLTLDPLQIPKEYITDTDNFTHKYITKLFNTLLINIKRDLLEKGIADKLKYVWVIEFQKNGNAHLHIVLDTKLDITDIRTIWTRIGGGKIMYIEKIKSLDSISVYLSKYLLKSVHQKLPHDYLHFYERRYSISQSCVRPINMLSPLIAKGASNWFTNKYLTMKNLLSVYNTLNEQTFTDGQIVQIDPPASNTCIDHEQQ